MFSITPPALAELQAAALRSQAEGMALRVAARECADGSIEFGMGFDDERESDETLNYPGLTVLLGGPSRRFLARTVLDYVELEAGRFDFVFMPRPEGDGSDDADDGQDNQDGHDGHAGG